MCSKTLCCQLAQRHTKGRTSCTMHLHENCEFGTGCPDSPGGSSPLRQQEPPPPGIDWNSLPRWHRCTVLFLDWYQTLAPEPRERVSTIKRYDATTHHTKIAALAHNSLPMRAGVGATSLSMLMRHGAQRHQPTSQPCLICDVRCAGMLAITMRSWLRERSAFTSAVCGAAPDMGDAMRMMRRGG